MKDESGLNVNMCETDIEMKRLYYYLFKVKPNLKERIDDNKKGMIETLEYNIKHIKGNTAYKEVAKKELKSLRRGF